MSQSIKIDIDSVVAKVRDGKMTVNQARQAIGYLPHVRYIAREEFDMFVERTPEIVWGVVRDNPDRFRSLGDLRRAVECGEIDADQWSELAQPHRLKMPVEFSDAFETVGVGVSALFRELEYKLLTYLMRRLVGKVGA